MTRHHRLPRNSGGTSEKRNISSVPNKLHEAWHTLFRTYDPYKIARLINRYWIDPDYYFEVRRRDE